MSEEKKESEVEAKTTEETKSEEPSAEEIKKAEEAKAEAESKVAQEAAAKVEANLKAVADAEAAVKEALEKAEEAKAKLESAAEEEYKAIAAEVKADTGKKVDYTFKRQGEEIFRRDMGEPEFWLEKEDRFPRPILSSDEQESITRQAETPQDQTPAYNPQDWKAVYPYRDQIVDRTLPDVGLARRKEMEGDNAEIDRKVTHQDDALQVLVKSVSGRILEKRLAALPEEIRQDVREALGTPNKDRKDIEQYLADKFQSLETFSEEDLIAERTSEEGGRMEQLRKQIQTLNKDRRNWGKIQALWDVGTPDKDHVFIRGNYQTLGPEVEPGFLEVLSDETTRTLFQQVNPTGDSSGRRLALAQWLTGENSPAASLVAAVMVNRIWQHLFGRGIVATPGNLGRNGQRPTHPKLLRWLSHTLIDGGWRIKPLIRTIMLSHAYQQQSSLSITWTAQSDNTQVSPESVDPGNELLWRQRLRRIESEVIRDCMLGISDRLDRTMGGPPVLLKARPDGMVVVSEDQLARPEDEHAA